MFEIGVSSIFSAAHSLRGYRGKCENLHGHNWKVEVKIKKNNLNSLGMVWDFRKLKMKLNRTLKELDHADLNRLTYFRKLNPTSENIARFIHERLKIKGLIVTVWETDSTYASFKEE